MRSYRGAVGLDGGVGQGSAREITTDSVSRKLATECTAERAQHVVDG